MSQAEDRKSLMDQKPVKPHLRDETENKIVTILRKQ